MASVFVDNDTEGLREAFVVLFLFIKGILDRYEEMRRHNGCGDTEQHRYQKGVEDSCILM